MKKRTLLIETIINFILILALFLTSSLLMKRNVRQNAEDQLADYGAVFSAVFDGGNAQEASSHFENIEIYIYGEDKQYITGNGETSDYPPLELKSLNTFTYPDNSPNFYYLIEDDGHYIYLGLEKPALLRSLNLLMIFGSLGIAIIFGAHLLFGSYKIKQLKKKTTDIIEELNTLTNNTILQDDKSKKTPDRATLKRAVKQVKSTLIKTNEELAKAEFVLDTIDQGVIVLDSYLRITLINNFALNLYGYSNKNKVVGKPAILLFQNIELQQLIEKTAQGETSEEVEFELGGAQMKALVHTYQSYETSKVVENAIVILLFDITDEKNLSLMKQEFFANASHELKSPLTSIIGYQQLIANNLLTEPEEIKTATDRTLKEATRMNQIIVEMLEIAELESNKPHNLEVINLKQLHEEIIGSLVSKLDERDIKVINNLDDLTLYINRHDAMHLFRNLFENALRYNVDGGIITLTSNQEQGIYSISDTGIGISPQNQTRIFERFYRVDKDRSKAKGGTGLGLAIVKHICQAYHFNITVNSKLRQGTIFKIEFNNQVKRGSRQDEN